LVEAKFQRLSHAAAVVAAVAGRGAFVTVMSSGHADDG